MKEKLIIRLATEKDEKAIAEFRISQYKMAKEFEIVNLNALVKQRGKLLLIETNDNIISTMQMEEMNNKMEFESIETGCLPANFKQFPMIYLSKAATAKEYRYVRLNSLLKYIILETTIKNSEVKSITGGGDMKMHPDLTC